MLDIFVCYAHAKVMLLVMVSNGARADHCGADGLVLSGSYTAASHHQLVPRTWPISL